MHRRSARGFTLIELMITVAIIGILAAIAYPSYINYVRKARRVDAKSLLLQAANREEQLYTAKYAYATSMTDLGLPSTTENTFYKVSAKQRDGDQSKFIVTATAAGDQQNDKCVAMTITETGEQKAYGSSDATGSALPSGTCW